MPEQFNLPMVVAGCIINKTFLIFCWKYNKMYSLCNEWFKILSLLKRIFLNCLKLILNYCVILFACILFLFINLLCQRILLYLVCANVFTVTSMCVDAYFKSLCICFRLLLAAFHYNENSNRPAKKDAEGAVKYSVHFPKAKRGEYSLKMLKENPTYGEQFYHSYV